MQRCALARVPAVLGTALTLTVAFGAGASAQTASPPEPRRPAVIEGLNRLRQAAAALRPTEPAAPARSPLPSDPRQRAVLLLLAGDALQRADGNRVAARAALARRLAANAKANLAVLAGDDEAARRAVLADAAGRMGMDPDDPELLARAIARLEATVERAPSLAGAALGALPREVRPAPAPARATAPAAQENVAAGEPAAEPAAGYDPWGELLARVLSDPVERAKDLARLRGAGPPGRAG